MKLLKIFIFVLTSLSLLLTFNSCDFPEHYFDSKPECQNSIDYFQTADSESTEYQSKALGILRNSQGQSFRYFFKTFLEEGRDVYMLTNFRNKEHCFDIKVLVDNWDKLQGMRRSNGKSYPNELYDLKWSIITIDGRQQVFYEDMHEIID